MPSPTDTQQEKKEFGAYLRRLRNNAGLTQLELATSLGMSTHNQIVRYEAGKDMPRGLVVTRWLGACGVKISEPPTGILRSTREILISIEESTKHPGVERESRDAPSSDGANVEWRGGYDAGHQAGHEAGFAAGWRAAAAIVADAQ
jgi:transcriptional regulator with XRE-family HTH domain